MAATQNTMADRPVLSAVTGTNGKTSVTTFLYQLFAAVGWSGSAYTSHGLRSPDGCLSAVEITNDAEFLPLMIAGEAARGATAMALEAFAGALAVGIYDAVEVDVAVCTGIESDHLDFHGTPQAYLAAKLLLFSRVLRVGGTAVIPVGGAACEMVAEVASLRGIQVVRVGSGGDIDLRDITLDGETTRGELVIEGGVSCSVELPFRDDITIQNALLAFAAMRCLGAPGDAIASGLGALQPAPGRLQSIASFDGIEVLVDTAHNPGALRIALRAARHRTQGKVIVVFGAGGERDAVKRPEMGEVAHELADVIVLTDDNPRNESPTAIRAAVRRGCPAAIEIPNRIDGIHAALRIARPGDIVLIAGRGDELVQEIGGQNFTLDDRDVARSLVAMISTDCAPPHHI